MVLFLTCAAVLHGTSIRAAIDANDPEGSIRRMAQSSAPDPMVACYIDSSFPAMLVFAYRYADSLEQGILASANAGGKYVDVSFLQKFVIETRTKHSFWYKTF